MSGGNQTSLSILEYMCSLKSENQPADYSWGPRRHNYQDAKGFVTEIGTTNVNKLSEIVLCRPKMLLKAWGPWEQCGSTLPKSQRPCSSTWLSETSGMQLSSLMSWLDTKSKNFIPYLKYINSKLRCFFFTFSVSSHENLELCKILHINHIFLSSFLEK